LHQVLEWIVTADEIWVRPYEPESKAQRMAWKRPTSLVTKKFKSQPSADKIMLTLLFGIWKVRFWFISLQMVKPLTDFHMFGHIKVLRGRRFSSDEEVIGAVQAG
jgi:hypothetical protein